MKIFSIAIPILFILIVSTPSTADAQRRDYMTDEEVEIIRNAQDIDVRIEMLTKMIDRRFAVLGIDVGGWKGTSKDSETWGPPPKGERDEIFSDIKRLLQKAIDDIDNLAEFPNSATVRDPNDRADARAAKDDPKRFPRAVHILAAAATRYRPALKSALDATKDERSKGAIYDAIDSCDQIIAAVTKLKG